MKPALPIVESRSTINRRELAIGYAASISYFAALLLLPALLFLNVFIVTVLAYFVGWAILASFMVGLPLAVLGQALAHRFPKAAVRVPTAFAVGALTSYLAFGIFALTSTGQFRPFFALGPDSSLGVAMVIAIAGFCSIGGWATARRNVLPTHYDDALDGLDFTELAALIRKAKQNDD